MKIAFVYDWFDKVGGAERILTVLHEMYPDAPWYTSSVDTKTAPWCHGWDVRPSFLQRFPLWWRSNRILSLFFFPLAFESFDFSEYDVVVSITSSFSKYIITKPTTRHICYLLTPTRWLWQDISGKSTYIPQLLRYALQRRDLAAAARVDSFITISGEVQKRCMRVYGRESEVIYPPFDALYWATLAKKRVLLPQMPKKYYLVVSRLEQYKSVDLVIEAWKGRTDALVIVGTGTLQKSLQAQAVGMPVYFIAGITDAQLASLYAGASALIMPQVEDYGYVALEAQACACPVVAFEQGGARETVERGVFFDAQTIESLQGALEKCALLQYNADTYENRHIRGRGRDTFVAAFSQKIPQTI